MENKKLIITTSWDDGHPLDLKLAELLNKYSIDATFYVPCKNLEHPVMVDSDLRELSNKYEIGGHTVNHIYLNTLKYNDAKNEISNCKLMLQEKLSHEITAFCFPGGKFSKRDVNMLIEAGFLFGRTTGLLHTTINTTKPIMNTSLQIYNHQYYTLIKHCLKRSFFSPILLFKSFIPYNKNFKNLAKAILYETNNENRVFHIWGHSWEIEERDLWHDLEETFKILKNENEAVFLNNSDCWQYLKIYSNTINSI